jgi:hypothetical protein
MLPPALPNSKHHGKVNETQFLEYFNHTNHLNEKFPFQNASALARGANYLTFMRILAFIHLIKFKPFA